MGAHVVHVEVVGKDGAALQRFYAEVLGWSLDTNNPGGYGMGRGVGTDITAGIGAAQDGGSGHVTFYVHTDDADATLKKVVELGGTIIMPLTQVAPETNVALFADPQGHIVGLM